MPPPMMAIRFDSGAVFNMLTIVNEVSLFNRFFDYEPLIRLNTAENLFAATRPAYGDLAGAGKFAQSEDQNWLH